MHLEEIDGAIVEDNTCYNQEIGIRVINSGGVEIKGNVCYNQTNKDINLMAVSNSNISLNKCYDNENYALYIQYCFNNTISNNTLMGSVMGIVLTYTNHCNFTYNLIQENVEWGVYLYPLVNEYNIFHHNSFISNALGLGIPQAYDAGNYSVWYDVNTNEGNFWNDYSGTGNYSIDGGKFADPYPLAESPVPIISELNINQFSMFFLLMILVVPSVLLIRKHVRN